MIETENKVQTFILAAVTKENGDEQADASLNELSELLSTDGGAEAGRVIQHLAAPSAHTYVGSGKVEEIRAMIEATGADGLICDDELTAAQQKNLTDELGKRVLDRTLLILDIFARHAVTKEGQTQVELAQLQYRLTRLTGMGTEMSRQGGSVGTAYARGAGETKLEMDRRHIRDRITFLKRELSGMDRRRQTLRSERQKTDLVTVALAGYTNAGKSTLFNRLTGAHVLEENKLFATLDTTVRRGTLPSGRTVLFIDTVGFIHKLPHDLVDAFHATLEEAAQADIILHVVDASDPQAQLHMKVAYDELVRLQVADRPVITVLNKQDLVTMKEQPPAVPYVSAKTISICALNDEDIKRLGQTLEEVISSLETVVEAVLPYSQAALLTQLHDCHAVLEESYENDGVHVKASVSGALGKRLKPYEVIR